MPGGQRQNAASAPVSPSASFASLEALRHSLAARTGQLDLEHSAHTFPIDDHSASGLPSALSKAGPSTFVGSYNDTRASVDRPSTGKSSSRRPSSAVSTSQQQEHPSSSSSTTNAVAPPLPPPLSLRNLPSPRSSQSPNWDRRISPFHEARGMSFTPAASPPAGLSPVTGIDIEQRFPPIASSSSSSATTSSMTRARGNSSSSGRSTRSAANSRSSSPSRQPAQTAHVRPARSRAHSDASGSSSRSSNGGRRTHAISVARPGALTSAHRSHSGVDLSGTSSVRPVPIPTTRTRQRSSSGSLGSNTAGMYDAPRSLPNGASSGGYPESEASDTGAEADADESPRRQRRIAPARTRSSPHLPFHSPVHLFPLFPGLAMSPVNHPPAWPTTTTAASADSSRLTTPSFERGQQQHSDYFAISPIDGLDQSAVSNQLWQLHRAALGRSNDTTGLGVELPAHDSQHGQPTLNDVLPPPPPYQANEEPLARPQDHSDAVVTSMPACGTRRSSVLGQEEEEGLAFATRRRRPSHFIEPDSERNVPSVSLVAIGQGNIVDQVQRRDSEGESLRSSLPPAWQPKSDTEAETDFNETDDPRSANRLLEHDQRSRNRLPASSRLARQIVALEAEGDDDGPSPFVLRWLLHPLRLLAAVPGTLGTFWLIRNASLHLSQSGSLTTHGILDSSISFPQRHTCGLDFLMASLWAMSTGYHALSLTTLLLRRWLIYYTLLPSLIRLIALQAICWPLVRLTIFIAGPDRPIEAWIVIATFTAFSDVVARWVTSNIADAPTHREVRRPGRQHRDEASRLRRSAGNNGHSSITSARASSLRGSTSRTGSRDRAHERHTEGLSTPSAALAASTMPTRSTSNRRMRAAQRFWRAIMGAPIDSSSSDSEEESDTGDGGPLRATAIDDIGRSSLTTLLTRRLRSSRAAGALLRASQGSGVDLDTASVHLETDADNDGETTDAGATTTALLDDDEDLPAEEALHRLRVALRRRRRMKMKAKMAAIHRDGGGSGAIGSSSFLGGSVVMSSGAVHIRSRRVFHWQVAMKRNVAPIGILAYLTLWAMLLGGRSATVV